MTRALTGATFSIGQVFFSIFNAARPVGSMLCGHDYAVLFSGPCPWTSVRRWTTWCGLRSVEVARGSRVLGMWCGTPSLDSVQRSSQVLQVGRFSRACAAFRIPAGEHNPFVSSLWKRPLLSRSEVLYMLISVLAVVVFENAPVCCSFIVPRHPVVICNVVLSAKFPPSQGYHISIGNILDNNQPSFSADMPHCVAVFVSDCSRHCVMNITVSRLSSLVSSCLDSGSTTTRM